MRLRNIPGAGEVIEKSPYVIHNPEAYFGKYDTVFHKKQPLYIEIGMGKGKFIIEMAKKYPEKNFIGIEMYSSVLLRALQKMEVLDETGETPLNLRFMCLDARNLTKIFSKGEVDGIYLNFSDPWPKDRHAKRRLPSRQFLSLYNEILNSSGKIEFKTDNRDLFEFALEELGPAGWKAEVVTYDLHQEKELVKGNVMTEYEEKFSSKGNPICKYIISR